MQASATMFGARLGQALGTAQPRASGLPLPQAGVGEPGEFGAEAQPESNVNEPGDLAMSGNNTAISMYWAAAQCAPLADGTTPALGSSGSEESQLPTAAPPSTGQETAASSAPRPALATESAPTTAGVDMDAVLNPDALRALEQGNSGQQAAASQGSPSGVPALAVGDAALRPTGAGDPHTLVAGASREALSPVASATMPTVALPSKPGTDPVVLAATPAPPTTQAGGLQLTAPGSTGTAPSPRVMHASPASLSEPLSATTSLVISAAAVAPKQRSDTGEAAPPVPSAGPASAPVAALAPQPAAQAQPLATAVMPPTQPQAAPPLSEQLARPLFTLTGAPLGEHVMTINVVPDELGPVTVRAHLATEGIRIELMAGNDAGREGLRHILGDLKRDLAAGGLTASLSMGGGSTGTDQGANHRTPYGSGAYWGAGQGTSERTLTDPPSSDLKPLRPGANNSLDITV